MGLWKIDTVSSEGWHQQMMRRHKRKMLVLDVLGVLLIVVLTVGMWFLFEWTGDQVHP